MDASSKGTVRSEQIPTNSWTASLWFQVLFFTALGLGVFFRLAGLGNKMYSHDEIYSSLYAAGYPGGFVFTSLWDGKVKTVDDIQAFLKPNPGSSLHEVLSNLAIYSPHQAPLFFTLEHYWMQLIGFTPAAMRGLAALFGCLSILAMYWLGSELFRSPRVALIATALFAVSPFQILFAQDARPYSLWTLITLLSSAALLRSMRTNTIAAWMLYSTTLILGIYTHQLFILVAVVHGLYFVSIFFPDGQKRVGGFLSAGLFAFLAYTPWLYFIITRWQEAASQLDVLSMYIPWHRFIQRWILLFSSPMIDLDLNSNLANLAPYFLRVLMLIFIVCAFLFLLKHASWPEKLFLCLVYIITAGTFIALDLLFGGMRSITGRYLVVANIATVLVVAYFLAAKLDQSRRRSFTRWAILLGTLVVVSLISNLNSLLAETWWTKELSRVRIEFIREISRDNTILIVSGIHPTNLGDVLLLSLEVDPDVQFILVQEPSDLPYPNYDRNVYWFPSSSEEVQEISEKKGLRVREVLPGTLWKIE